MGIIKNIFKERETKDKSVDFDTNIFEKQCDIYKELNEMRALFCEDHPINIEITLKMLEKIGMDYDVAKNGKAAVDLFEKSQEGYYDVILMDIVMPVMSGIEATKHIRALDRTDSKIPVIALTASAIGDALEIMHGEGIVDVLEKPFEIEELVDALKKY